jgi:hypothetical protein
MRGLHDSHGNITIVYNSQYDAIEAPGGLKYLPCEICGTLARVPSNTVSVICELPWDKQVSLYRGTTAADRVAHKRGTTYVLVACQFGHDLLHSRGDESTATECCNTHGCLCRSDEGEGGIEWLAVLDEDERVSHWPMPSRFCDEDRS